MVLRTILISKSNKAFLGLSILSLAIILSGCTGRYFHEIHVAEPHSPVADLSQITFRELWYGVIFNGRKIGFAHIKIEKEGESDIFRIESETLIRFKLMGIGKEVSSREIYTTNGDLSLKSFSSDIQMGGTRKKVKGEVEKETLNVAIETENSQDIQSITLNEKIYPGVAMYLYPIMMGLEIGKEYSYKVYSPETLAVETVYQKVKAYEVSELFEGSAFKLENSLGGMNSDSWINIDKGMLLEMALHGAIIYSREDELTGKRFIYSESIAKNDLLLDYSLIKTDKRITQPRKVKFLEIEVAGLDENDLVISDEMQKTLRVKEKVKYIITSPLLEEDHLILPIENEKLRAYLKPSAFIQSGHREIIVKSQEILKGEKSAVNALKMLTKWVADEIKDSMTDSFSSLDVLHKKEGECQAHVYLYTALARAAGIPTKVVSGLVYLEDYGFLYHSWAESYVGSWIPVDPTFGQVPADATHIKLVEGERFEDLSKLVNVIGRINAKVVSWK
jgi:transglutaminase-like putative cysteine protease